MSVVTAVVAILLFSVVVALAFGRGISLADRHAPLPTDVEIRQPEVRTWVCSDGNMRTAAEAADWCAATPGSDAYWLDAWIFGETVPDYVPQEWAA